ncbi:MAG: glycoside hydrolase family 3 C-terminal domain-containing protein [Oscillospiraceae bacterium]|nr:glycoside hydrolase family 3 C-terminal domain-containing protein [Oscillospiraceae bacterium]
MNYKQRAKELVAQMTVEEKISQMTNGTAEIERLGIPRYNWWNEGLHGVGRAGTATVFPQAIGLAAAFDRELMFRVATAISDEFRAKYNQFVKHGDLGEMYKGITVWSPNINIFRDPRWGRGHETYGEDTYLTSRLAVDFVKGLQGDDPNHNKTDATLKHYAVHSGPEKGRNTFDSVTNKKDLYETYTYSFEYAIRHSRPAAVMAAYNAVNGVECVRSEYMIDQLLRGEFGFEGYYLSDCGAVCDLFEPRKVAADKGEASAMAVNAGCDLCCGNAYYNLIYAYDKGQIKEDKITESCERLMEARLRLGMGQKTVYDDIPCSVLCSKEHLDLSRDAAVKSAVLLKNNGILPLNKDGITVSVCGPNADDVSVLCGNYNGTPSRDVTMLEGIQDYIGEENVYYSEGCKLFKPGEERLSEALINALHSDVVVTCVGLAPQIEGEAGDAYNSDAGGDKTTLALPAVQQNLLEKLYESEVPVIIVNISGSAVLLGDHYDKAAAIIQMFYPGEKGGDALASILFGDCSPSGKLPVTFYAGDDQLPDFHSYSMDGRTYKYLGGKPTFPFGYGLNYGDVNIDNVSYETLPYSINLDVTLSNNSSIGTHDVLQVYARRLSDCGTGSPYFKLCGFKKIYIPANDRVTTNIVGEEIFAYYNKDGKQETLPGKYEIFVGTSQPDDRSFELTGKRCYCIELNRT